MWNSTHSYINYTVLKQLKTAHDEKKFKHFTKTNLKLFVLYPEFSIFKIILFTVDMNFAYFEIVLLSKLKIILLKTTPLNVKLN